MIIACYLWNQKCFSSRKNTDSASISSLSMWFWKLGVWTA